MADTQNAPPSGNATGTGASQAGAASSQPPKQNPALRMMGIPNFKFKLPSRNWLIFWGIVGSWSAALVYDRREKKKSQEKWCALVSHLAQDPLHCKQLQRRLTIVLSAPPADGLMSAREHFHDYVKPVLVASGLDWDVIEGRKEGDVRAALAERIRKLRKRREGMAIEAVEGEDDEEAVLQYREKVGVYAADGVAGDIVIGRNTWKEYIRGLHEGWLGPLEAPPELQNEATPTPPASTDSAPSSSSSGSGYAVAATSTPSEAAPVAGNPTEEKPAEEKPTEEKPAEEKPAERKKRKQPPPFIPTSAYTDASPPSYIPSELGPSTVLPFPHILGFLNTPIRMKRFLGRRHLAEDVGREVAAAVFAVYRPYDQSYGVSSPSDDNSPSSSTASDSMIWEQQGVLRHEEREWHKSIRKDREEGKESVWLDEPVLDERIAGRMRRFVLEPEQESRAQRIRQGKETAVDRYKDDDKDLN